MRGNDFAKELRVSQVIRTKFQSWEKTQRKSGSSFQVKPRVRPTSGEIPNFVRFIRRKTADLVKVHFVEDSGRSSLFNPLFGFLALKEAAVRGR